MAESGYITNWVRLKYQLAQRLTISSKKFQISFAEVRVLLPFLCCWACQKTFLRNCLKFEIFENWYSPKFASQRFCRKLISYLFGNEQKQNKRRKKTVAIFTTYPPQKQGPLAGHYLKARELLDSSSIKSKTFRCCKASNFTLLTLLDTLL